MLYKSVKADSETVRRQNRHLILETIRRHGPASRTRLSDMTELSSASVSAITGDLLAEGLLVETPALRRDGGARGRPQIRLRLNPGFARVVSAQITVAEIGIVIADYSGDVVARQHKAIAGSQLDGTALVDAVIGQIVSTLDRENLSSDDVMRMEVAVQGIVDAERRRLLWTPFLTGRGIDLAEPLRRRLGAPCQVVNDCAAMVEGLHWMDPDHYGGNFVVMLIGYGVGAGLFLNGRTFTGRRSSAAEFGHTNHRPGGALCRCGRHGCIEAYAGDYAIWRRATGRDPMSDPAAFNPSEDDMWQITERARAGDAEAVAAFRDAGQAIGFGLGRLFALVDPIKIVFTGTGMRAFDLLEPHIRDGLKDSLVEEMSDTLDFEVIADESALVFRGAIMGALADLDRNNSATANGTSAA